MYRKKNTAFSDVQQRYVDAMKEEFGFDVFVYTPRVQAVLPFDVDTVEPPPPTERVVVHPLSIVGIEIQLTMF